MNKYQEATNYFKNRVAFQTPVYDKPQFKILLELVDKATPMKLIKDYFVDDDGEITFQLNCPHGHSFIGRASFCPKCGQAFERSS